MTSCPGQLWIRRKGAPNSNAESDIIAIFISLDVLERNEKQIVDKLRSAYDLVDSCAGVQTTVMGDKAIAKLCDRLIKSGEKLKGV